MASRSRPTSCVHSLPSRVRYRGCDAGPTSASSFDALRSVSSRAGGCIEARPDCARMMNDGTIGTSCPDEHAAAGTSTATVSGALMS